MSRADTVIALVANSTQHGTATNTRNALVSAGFTLSNILTTAESGTIPACDIIVICRGIATQALYDSKIKPAFESGTPVIFGSANVSQGGQSIAATYANLTGVWTITSSSMRFVNILDNTHPITTGQATGVGEFCTGATFSMYLQSDAPLYSQVLAESPAGNGGDIIPLEAGHVDLLGNPTAARCVLFGNVYGFTTYTQLGIDLIGASIDWALGGGDPPASRRRSPLMLTPW